MNQSVDAKCNRALAVLRRVLIASGLFVAIASVAETGGAGPRAIYELNFHTATYLEVDLDREIYRYSPDPRLRDLMVLDIEGRELPSRIISLQPELTQGSNTFPLRFFPVMTGEDPSTWLGHGGEPRIDELLINEEGLSLRLGAGSRASEGVEFYLVDISKLEHNLDVLEIDWLAEETNRVVAVEIHGSNDLQQWRSLARATLAHLISEEDSLLRNTVDFPVKPEQYRYLRLRFATTPVIVQALSGHEVVRHLEGPAPQRWRLSGALAADQKAVEPDRSGASRRSNILAWEFQRDDRAPANRLSIDLGDTSYGERMRIYSRNTAHQPWQLRHSGIWFNVKVGDEWQQSKPLDLRAGSEPFWRLELGSAARSAQPQLLFEHPQQRLQFIANNNPPYFITLSHEVPSRRSAEEVFASVVNDQDVVWQFVDKRRLAGAQAIEIRNAFNWQALLFWFSLGLAVVVLVVFALRLLRQMDGAK